MSELYTVSKTITITVTIAVEADDKKEASAEAGKLFEDFFDQSGTDEVCLESITHAEDLYVQEYE